MSNERRVRIPSTECLRFPEEGSSAQGQSGPKSRPKGVDDGQQVDIPVPPPRRLSDGGTQEDRECTPLVERVQAARRGSRQIRFLIRRAVMGSALCAKFLISHCQEKPLARREVPVPQTDTGSRGENPKVSERTLVK